MWFLAILFVGSLVASILLTPKVKTENARAGAIDDMSFPKADEGAPINLVLGRVLVKGPNTLWAGDFKAIPIKKKQKTGLFSSKKVIVGYTYYVGFQLGLGIGPLTLHKIICDKDDLWTGTANADGQVLAINKPNLFGGKEKGGGFIGTARFYTGGFTQGINAYLEGRIGAGDVPAYRGTCHLVFEKPNIGESNQLRQMSMEVSRYTNGLGLAGGLEKIGDDMNPMELLYQAFTLGWGGLNVSPDLLDLDSLRDCAAVLFDESNGMSLNIASANGGKDITNEVVRQVDGLMYQDPLTGKIVFKLIRYDYVIEDLPVFDESNVIAVRGYTSKLWEDTNNQVRVKYTNRDKNYVDGIAGVQDLANISAQERIKSVTNSYPGCMRGDLATDLATRDLSQTSVPLLAASLETNREGANLRPGDVFVWAWKEYNIGMVVMRVKNFDLGALNDNKIAFDCNQDTFAVNQTVFAPPSGEGSGIVRPDTEAGPATVRFVSEAPYFFANAGGLSVGDTQTFILVAAVPPTASDEYDVYTSNDTVTYNMSESGSVYTPVGTLNTAITAAANRSTGIIPSITITSDSDEIEPVTAGEIAQGYGLFYIDGELFAHEGVTDNGDGTFTLANVRRSLLDTYPAAHSSGARVWFVIGDNIVEDVFNATDNIRVKLTPRTISDTLDVNAAPYDALTLANRANRPLHPGNIQFDAGTPFAAPANATGSKTVTWANRSRTSLVIYSTVDPTSETELTQRTVIRYRIDGGAWVEHETLPGVTTYTFDAGATPGQVVDYEVFARRDGLDSFSRWTGTATAS